MDIGTSFGYNNKLKKSRFPSFSEVEKSSYNSPITSYDAPIAPSSKVLESEEKKSLRKIKKVKKEKLTKSEYQAPITEQYGKGICLKHSKFSSYSIYRCKVRSENSL